MINSRNVNATSDTIGLGLTVTRGKHRGINKSSVRADVILSAVYDRYAVGELLITRKLYRMDGSVRELAPSRAYMGGPLPKMLGNVWNRLFDRTLNVQQDSGMVPVFRVDTTSLGKRKREIMALVYIVAHELGMEVEDAMLDSVIPEVCEKESWIRN